METGDQGPVSDNTHNVNVLIENGENGAPATGWVAPQASQDELSPGSESHTGSAVESHWSRIGG